jgi:hypothetical protein
VDDERTMLDLSSDWAGAYDGIDWLTASDPDTGLELLSTHDVDCLVSDSFRTADGDPFVTHAATTFPDLPVVLFTSMDRDALDPAVRDSSVEYVTKGSADPFGTLFDRVLSLADDAEDDDRPSSPVDSAPRATTRTAGDDAAPTEQWVPIGRYRPAEGDDLTTTIVTAVEAYTGRDASALPPLYGAIDAEALAALLRPGNDQRRDHIQVRFVYADQELAVTGDGFVLVRS